MPTEYVVFYVRLNFKALNENDTRRFGTLMGWSLTVTSAKDSFISTFYLSHPTFTLLQVA